MKLIKGMRELVDSYEGFILDQYGVLHDGTKAYPGAVSCIKELAQLHGKRLIILSNSSKREDFTLQGLATYGFEMKHFNGAITSGEEVWKAIQLKRRGQKCVWLTWDEAADPYTLQREYGVHASDVDEADFLFVQGTEQIVTTESKNSTANWSTTFPENGDCSVFHDLMVKAIARNIPMLCANPDFISVQKQGKVYHMPGRLAKFYESLNGTVEYYGKPHAEHFHACISRLGLQPHQVVHVGDSMHHDIKGAIDTGIDSVLIGCGVHVHELSCPTKDARDHDLDTTKLNSLCSQIGFQPTYALASFAW